MLRYFTAGESHGEALVAFLSGIPAGLKIDQAFLDRELWRRQQGYGRGGRMTNRSPPQQSASELWRQKQNSRRKAFDSNPVSFSLRLAASNPETSRKPEPSAMAKS